MNTVELTWRKSSHSGGTSGQCVELAALGAAYVGIRDSKNPSRGHLSVGKGGMATLVASVKAGAFDI
ncbi:DUF397 domain-containing protein [Actinomadura rayongensis]|uniref:DUF397 domain-containing protein n=1 Tax=Actinomadura rayongensis TaxID=1429076 RepID=A0A6I4W9Z7_9ACTN|nr:DUF397 domain-containing protein [Actinomadura rayongensis]MXQ65600.1 DUF397 domain-containing protein [Actinomadura rayongensis]